MLQNNVGMNKSGQAVELGLEELTGQAILIGILHSLFGLHGHRYASWVYRRVDLIELVETPIKIFFFSSSFENKWTLTTPNEPRPTIPIVW